MKRTRALHAAAGFVATLGISGVARAVDIEPLHMDISLRGHSIMGEGCEGGEWSLSWQGDLPGETRNIGDLLISYSAFDTTLEDDRVDPKPRFTHTPLVCRDKDGREVMRATMTSSGNGKIRGVLAIKNDPAFQSPFFTFDVKDLGNCQQKSQFGTTDIPRLTLGVVTQQVTTISPALGFTRKELEEGFTKTYKLGGIVVGGDGFCLGSQIDQGQLTISYKQDIRKPKVEFGTCAHVAKGASTQVTAKPSPAGGVLSITSDPSATMAVQLSGNSATVTGATPGRATLTARYVLNGQTATATLPASSIELVSVNGGAPIPKLGLYGADGMISSKVYQFPVATNPADAGDLLSFSAANSAIVSVINGRSNVGIQPVRAGRTTIQAKTACGAAIGPPVEVVIAACDDDVRSELQRKRDDLARRESEMVKRITRLVADSEFQRAATEIKASTQEFAIKSGELIVGALTAKEVVAGRRGDATSALNAKQLENIGNIWDGYNAISDGIKGEWDKAFWGGAVMKLGMWQVSLAKTAYETREATLKFSKDLGTIAGVARELEELGPKYEDIRQELYRMDTRLNRCEELPPPPPPPPKKGKPTPPKPQPIPEPQEPTTDPTPVPVPQPQEPTPPVPPPGPPDPPRGGSAGLCVRPISESPTAQDFRDVVTATSQFSQVLQQSVPVLEGFDRVLKDATAAGELAEPQRAESFRALAPRYDAVMQQFYKLSEATRAQAERFTLCTNTLPEWINDLKTPRY
jgi:hypothetical protein